MKFVLKNGNIHDAINETPYVGDILVVDGKIAEIGKVDCDCEVVDATGLEVYPGFVEAHGHIGLHGYGIGFENNDVNERNDVTACHLRGLDGFNPLDPALIKAAQAGITSVCTGPGSANVFGGTATTIKTAGHAADDMIIKEEVAMKCAFGENPKRVHQNSKDSTRMTTAAIMREMLFKARNYVEAKDAGKNPAWDMKMEALEPVIRGQMPLKAHAHAAIDILTVIRIAKEFNLKLTLEHVTEGHLIAEELSKYDYPCAVGPTMTNASKFELKDKSWTTPAVLAEKGLPVSIITDSPVIPQEYLPICAGYAVKNGMDPFKALQAITINAAKHAQIEDRVGSLEVGKDADIVVTNGNPMEISTEVKMVYIDGVKVK